VDTNWSISVVRTVVAPLFLGLFIQWLCFLGSDPPDLLRVVTTFFFALSWYVCSRSAQYRNPQSGWLLLVAVRPHYDDDVGLTPSIRRTAVSLAVAATAGCLVTTFWSGSTAALCVLLVALTYYGALRLIEVRSAPDSTARGVAGWLLGARAVPYY